MFVKNQVYVNKLVSGANLEPVNVLVEFRPQPKPPTRPPPHKKVTSCRSFAAGVPKTTAPKPTPRRRDLKNVLEERATKPNFNTSIDNLKLKKGELPPIRPLPAVKYSQHIGRPSFRGRKDTGPAPGFHF